MRQFCKYITVVFLLVAVAMTVGCGEDKLVMVTTENDTSSGSDTDANQNSAETTESIADQIAATAVTTEEEVVIEEPSEEESKITLDQIYNMNRGDMLLSGGVSYSLNTIYYANDEEVYSEFQFLGFDDNGNYLQVYEDSDGYVQLLDKENLCWYIIEDNALSTLIYPEPGVADSIIEYNHNNMIFASSDDTDGVETIKDIYRANGELTVEVKYEDETGDYIYKYIIDSDLKVKAYTCYGSDGNKISYSWVTEDADYTIPEAVEDAEIMDIKRNVTIAFPDGDGVECTYSVSSAYPVQIRMLEYNAYLDKDCAIVWSEAEPMDNGFYTDETIYLKK